MKSTVTNGNVQHSHTHVSHGKDDTQCHYYEIFILFLWKVIPIMTREKSSIFFNNNNNLTVVFFQY